MKLFKSLAVLAGCATAESTLKTCVTCEYVGVAATEAAALDLLRGSADGSIDAVPCSVPVATTSSEGYTVSDAADDEKYCVATFFMFEAKDIGNKIVFGVKRYVSDSQVSSSRIDVEGYEGVKGITSSVKQNTLADAVQADANASPPVEAADAIRLPAFVERDSNNDGTPLYMGDGREDVITTGDLSTVNIQTVDSIRCLVCHDAQEFSTAPLQSSDITMPCWNPSGNVFATDDEAARDPSKYCSPDNGLCMTKTWQYKTQNEAKVVTSHWVAISRGCASADDETTVGTTSTAVSPNNRNVVSDMFVRFYAATNTASKAKDNAKYPDADVSTHIDYSNAGAAAKDADITIRPITAQYMSSDGSGAPDVPPVAAATDELECYSCTTPIGNTDSANDCVTAKTTGRVKCKTLACSAITSSYKLGEEATETYYYAKRGCAADPDDGVTDGEQEHADDYVVPDGWTNIKQYNQRSLTANGNTGRSSSISTAQVFDCYSCESSFSTTVSGANPADPVFDSVKEKDTALCWQTFKPVADSSSSATGTSGSCTGKCFVSAYKYKESTGSTKLPATTFNWYIKRGCDTEMSVINNETPAPALYGISQTNRVCDYTNGTLCNGLVEGYDTTLEIATQSSRLLQCFTCETPAGNTDPEDPCYTVPSTTKAKVCPDLSYTSCSTTETAYTLNGQSFYGIKRACHKGDHEDSTQAVAGFKNVNSETTHCTSGSCNKANGKTTDLVVAVESSSGSGTENETEESGAAVVAFSGLMAVTLALFH